MKYQIKHNGVFDISIKEDEIDDGIVILHLEAKSLQKKEKLNFSVNWQIPDVGINLVWSPGKYCNKEKVPNWGSYEKSCAMSLAPVYSNMDYNDFNKQTIACSDAKNTVNIHTGVIEENACLDSVVTVNVDYPVDEYCVDIRIDTRNIPFYKAVDSTVQWWSGYDGYEPAKVPDSAYDPVYSTWYSFHQDINVDEIVKQCEYFSKLGCKTVIVDDGWQTDNNKRGYDYCGDWRVTDTKIDNMKSFVDAVHQTGMKFMLWYSVPYVGEYSEVYEKFKDKMLYKQGPEECRTYVVDPRYPEIREYLIGIYKKAMLDWGLDGFKLDFVDSFKQSDDVKEGMDYVSVYDAVDRLLKDVIRTLKEVKPDILIEFRQSYIGPLMRTFGNMFRSLDCPTDSWTNQMNILAVRMTSGNTAVHSDMVMWNYNETAEEAAFQLTRVLFSTPQISVREELMDDRQKAMVERYLKIWNKYKNTIVHGEMFYKGYANNFPYVSARSENEQIGAVYGGQMAYVDVPTKEIVLVNSSMDSNILVNVSKAGMYNCSIFDCCGLKKDEYKIDLNKPKMINNVPVNGTVVFEMKQ